MMIYILQ